MSREKIRETIYKDSVQSLLDNECIKRFSPRRDLTLADIIMDEGGPESVIDCEVLANLLTGGADAVFDIQHKLKPRLRDLIEKTLDSATGQDYLDRCVSDQIEYAKEEAAVAKREARLFNRENPR